MCTTAIIPVEISSQARAFVEAVGQGEELAAIIDWARHLVPGLRSIEVVLDDATVDMPPAIVLWTHRDDVGPDDDPTLRNWIEWMTVTFPPEICQNFTLLPVYHPNGR
jgi:hypothetical protein